ncbi:MAG: hypothetical protein R6X25_08975 [Candidatus Krumholzibacteriia bacterium]
MAGGRKKKGNRPRSAGSRGGRKGPARAAPGGNRRAGSRGGQSLRRKRVEKRRGLLERIDALLHGNRARTGDALDRRSEERPPPARVLSIRGNRELFERLVALDFEYLLSRPFAADTATLRVLLPQSVLGRAQNGHGWFRDADRTPLTFPEATFDRILGVLERLDPGMESRAVRQERGARLTTIRDHVLDHLGREQMPLQVGGRPLLGVDFLAGHLADTRAFLTGMVLAGFMDDFHHREMAVSYQPLTHAGEPLELGGGEIHVARPQRLAQLGILDPGSAEFSERDIEHLRMLDVILPSGTNVTYTFGDVDQVYFRRKRGEGVCDDLALIFAAARFGFDAMLGAFVMDGIDTYDKFIWEFTGENLDTRLARDIQSGWQDRRDEPVVAGEAVLELIHFAAKMNAPPAPLSSSHRRFIQYEPGARIPTLLNHWRFTQGEPIYDIELGYARFPGRKFYDIARRRLAEIGIDVPEPDYVVRRRGE